MNGIENNLIDNFAVFLKDLAKTGFYGTVEASFVNGELTLVRKEETYKPVFFLRTNVVVETTARR